EHEAGQLALRACCGLKRDGVEPRDLGQRFLELDAQAQRSLRALLVLERVQIAEPGQRGEALVDARVVLHRARAERVEAGVDPEVACGELREVTEEIRLGDLGQARRLGPAELGRDPRDREPYVRGVAGAAARAGLLEDQLHRASTSASRSIWSFVRRS